MPPFVAVLMVFAGCSATAIADDGSDQFDDDHGVVDGVAGDESTPVSTDDGLSQTELDS